MGRVFNKAIVLSALVFFMAGQMAFAAAPQLNIAGQVHGAGVASMKTATGWMSVSGKDYPVANGSNLVTGENGGMTITLKNGARLEMGKNSEVVISSSNGKDSVLVQRGTMAYNVPQSAQIAINTANTQITVNALSQGFVGEGKDTYIKSIAGNASVSSPNKASSSLVKAGETLRVAQANGTFYYAPVSYDQAEIESAIAADPAPVADASAGTTGADIVAGSTGGISTTTGLLIGGAVVGGAIAAVAATTHSGSSSPY